MGSLKRLILAALFGGGLSLPGELCAEPVRGISLAEEDRDARASDADEGLSDEAELARVVSLVDAAKYEECVAELERLLDPKSPRPLKNPEVIETARVYQATCYIGLGKPELADEPLAEAIRKNPQMRPPDSLLFPQRVVERFLRVREGLYAELRAAEQAAIQKARREAAERQRRENERWAKMLMLERLARQEVVVVKNRRWIAAVPFGVGQFQNGNEPLGWVFLGTQAALGLTALTALAVHSHTQARVEAAGQRGNTVAPDVNQKLSDWRLAMQISSYGFLALAAIGVSEAQLNFVPEVRTVRDRPLPELSAGSVTLSPELYARGDGAVVGVRGSF